MPLNTDRLAFFPLWPVVEGKCGCRNPACTSKPGKHPCFNWSGLGVAEKLGGPDGCGYGIATGERSGLFVIDLDGEEAMQWWADQCSVAGVDPWTTYSMNTSRGCHLYFQLPDFPVKNSASMLFPKVDVRGEGGYVVAEGSVHVSGHVYTVENESAEVEPAPEWLLARAELRGVARGIVDEGENAPLPVDVDSVIGKERLRAGVVACATMPPSIEGENGSDALWNLSMKLVRELELPIEAALELVESVFNPRCQPAWGTNDILHKLVDVRDKSNKPTGPVPTDEQWDALCAKLRKTSRRNGLGVTIVAPEGGHGYLFVPGESTSAMSDEPKAALPVDVANTLSNSVEWDGVLRWNTFNNRLVAVGPPLKMDAEQGKISDADVAHVRMWLSCHGKLSLKEDTTDAMNAAARRRPFHPIIDYLEPLVNTDPEILDTLAAQVFGNPDPLAQEFLKKTLVAAVRRIYRPGTRVDTVLTLMGKQGAKKTTFVQVLFGEAYVRSQMPDLSNKDASIALQDFWAVELGELHKTLKTDHGTVKEFLSRTYDDFRPPHGRNDIRMPRHNIFIGTVNDDTFLSDATGNRRFWPIAVQKVDIDYVSRNRDAIWAAAVALEKSGYCHWFEDERVVEPAHAAFIVQDPWHQFIRDYISGRKMVTNEDVFLFAIGGEDKTKYGTAAQRSIADTLKRLGCTRKRSNGKTGWEIPGEIAAEPQSMSRTDRLNSRRE